MTGRLKFSGPAQYRVRGAAAIARCSAEVYLRRLLKGPRRPSWNFAAELGTEILKRQLQTAFEMTDVKAARSYLDSLVVDYGITSKVSITIVAEPNFKGSWFLPPAAAPNVVVLYLHGGGYSFYPKSSYDNLTALIALSVNAKTFALDYRLSPEFPFPAQLIDATECYRWLLSNGVDPSHIVILGDSAGGNLTLALLLSLRDSKLPLPALAICLSPATSFEATALVISEELSESAGLDWIEYRMALRWADWYCSPEQRRNPLVSPLNADLRGLCPIYIQAGGAEILLPSIQAFVDHAKDQQADVTLEIWPDMNHDFQMFGHEVPQSAEALKRIGAVVESVLTAQRKTISKS
jgi:monoterpene epsilon-lactone hydrolase